MSPNSASPDRFLLVKQATRTSTPDPRVRRYSLARMRGIQLASDPARVAAPRTAQAA